MRRTPPPPAFIPVWLSGQPPGEPTTYFSEEYGRHVTVYPAGFAEGGEPQPSVGSGVQAEAE